MLVPGGWDYVVIRVVNDDGLSLAGRDGSRLKKIVGFAEDL
jgi:hypothetical protein